MSDYARNAPCPCGSGKKYKRCCGQNVAPRMGGGDMHAYDAGISYQQAVALYQQGDLQGAEAICKQLLQKKRNDIPALELSAGIALQRGDARQAASFLLRQVKLQPHNAIVHSNLGMALHELGRSDEAYRHCQKAIAIQPDLAEAYNNLGHIYKARNDLQKAVKSYEKALDLGARDPRIHVNAGLVSQLLGDLPMAERRYRSALELFPDFAPAHNNLGAVLQRLGRDQEAETHFSRALELQPNDSNTHNNLGGLYLARGELENARRCFERSLQLDPASVEALANLGLLYDELGEMEHSREAYAKALSLGMGNPAIGMDLSFDLGRHLSGLEERCHNLDEAESIVARFEGLGVCSPALTLFKARLLRRRKAFRPALDQLQSIDEAAFNDRRFYMDFLFELPEPSMMDRRH